MKTRIKEEYRSFQSIFTPQYKMLWFWVDFTRSTPDGMNPIVCFSTLELAREWLAEQEKNNYLPYKIHSAK